MIESVTIENKKIKKKVVKKRPKQIAKEDKERYKFRIILLILIIKKKLQ